MWCADSGLELTGEQAGWGPARVRMAGLSRAGYVCEVLAGSGPLVLVLTGRKLPVSELLAIGGPPARRDDSGRFPGLRRRLPGAARHLSFCIFTASTGAVLLAPSPVMCAVTALT
jgi:hypothetical protein